MTTGRNELCACGSGRRYKHCHGSVGAAGAPAPDAPRPARFEALDAHRVGALGRAEALYRQALAENPQDVDSLHMLGVVQYERMRYRDALALLTDAAERTGWNAPTIRHNLGLVFGKLMSREANQRQEALLGAFTARERARKDRDMTRAPLVSVVLRVGNHAGRVVQAIDSVAAQTWPAIELVVVDDASGDGSAAIAAGRVTTLGIPVRVVTRTNADAVAAYNEGVRDARGEFVAFLEGSDAFARERIARMVDEVARGRALWGFSRVDAIPDESSGGEDAAAAEAARPRNFLAAHPNSFTMLEYNVLKTPGNLFVERELFLAIGGFRNTVVPFEWEFCVRASATSEPVAVDNANYQRSADVKDAAAVAGSEQMSALLFAELLAGKSEGTNPLGPQAAANRTLLLRTAFRAGHGERIPVDVMRALAAQWTATHNRPPDAAQPADARAAKIAIVVMGMHRSGTSAMSRVLNLCGAYLPEKVMPPKLGVNPKGFWEPEAVVDLDARIIGHLGGDWNRVDFTLPREGELVDEFLADARALLMDEYGERALIVLKDPRICVLAPLWDAALRAAGYAPAYVVPVRSPLEVAQSLEARGDMTIGEGLALWLAYMQRVEAFTATQPNVAHARFSDLIDDWRSVVGRIATDLALPLDATTQAAEVDRFIERSLRNQTASDEMLDARLGEAGEPIRALYARLLARCDAPRAGALGTGAQSSGPPIAVDGTGESAAFVLCIEDNAIREQALLLCESIRRHAGRHANAAIVAYSPRVGLAVDRETRARLAELRVDYVDEPLNTLCPEYAPTNRVFAGAHAERHVDADFLIVVDSDTVWLGEPALPRDADVGVRPVDEKGSATSGPGDPFEDYWQAVARLCGISLDRLPWVRSTIGNERIRASYNAGLTIARRKLGILSRCADLFTESVHAGLRPYRGTGIDIIASTGSVGRAGSEYWGSSQTVMTLAIWASTSRVIHYPDTYNVPLPWLGSHGDVDPRWSRRAPVQVHYHGMFAGREYEVALDLLETLGAPAAQRDWLRQRLPLGDAPRNGASARGATSPAATGRV